MYGSIPGNAVVVNFLMRFPILIPVAAAVGIATAVPEPVVVAPVVSRVECVVLFDTDKSVVLPSELAKLKDCMKSVNLGSTKNVLVKGYTDSRHTDTYNLGLSLRRANSVKQAIVDLGVDSKVVTTEHFGKKANFGDNTTKAGRQQNRRVNVTIQ